MTITPCPPSTTPSVGVVVFVPDDFRATFPMFSTVGDAALQLSFDLATTQLSNTCCSRVRDANERATLLNLLTAHTTQLKDGINGQPPAGVVGRIDKATEGSVSVSADVGTVVYGQAYYLQTQFGFLYWQATAKYRQAVYVPAPPTCADFNGGLGFPGSFWPNLPGGQGPFGGGGCGC